MKCNILPSLASLADLPDRDLLAVVERSLSAEREATACLVAHLGEIDARRLYAAEAFGSMFEFCVEALHMAEGAAYNRIAAARAARRFPVILEMLAAGSVHVTAVRLLAPHLTPENHRELLAAARHKSRREVEHIVAALAPQPPVPSSIRRLPVKTSAYQPPPAAAPLPAAPQTSGPVRPALPLAGRPAVVAPLSAETYKVQCTVSEKTHDKLRLAQDMLRHQIPNGDIAEILDRALAVLLEQLARQKFAATGQPRPGRATTPGSRHIPAEVKRAVWLRDLGRCTFVAENGRRCGATGFVEFHHVMPFAAGGEATVENLRLTCRLHNAYEAELAFGPPRIREERAAYKPAIDSSRDEYTARAP
jgi:hypothetical protein